MPIRGQNSMMKNSNKKISVISQPSHNRQSQNHSSYHYTQKSNNSQFQNNNSSFKEPKRSPVRYSPTKNHRNLSHYSQSNGNNLFYSPSPTRESEFKAHQLPVQQNEPVD